MYIKITLYSVISCYIFSFIFNDYDCGKKKRSTHKLSALFEKQKHKNLFLKHKKIYIKKEKRESINFQEKKKPKTIRRKYFWQRKRCLEHENIELRYNNLYTPLYDI